jgi:hypothetical protein
LFARWGSSLLVRFLSSTMNTVYLDLNIDGRMLAFTAGAAVLTGLLFGLVPAWRATRLSLNGALKEGGRGGTETRSHFRLGRVLVALQVGLSCCSWWAPGCSCAPF